MFIPEISTKVVSTGSYDNNNVMMYRLTNSTIEIYNAIRHIGFPLFTSSFDFYCFIVSLMCDVTFYNTVVNDERLYHLWKMMWQIDDLQVVEELLKETHNFTHDQEAMDIYDSPVNIIRGKWLRCDVVKHIWSLIKLGC